MIYTIENKEMKIAVDASGAQLQSVYSKKTDTEYLWQGDKAYWTGRAYNLFPVVGRMYKNTYTYGDKEYNILCHGLARRRLFRIADRSATKLTFLLKEDEEGLEAYPFRFEFYVSYRLRGTSLTVTYSVKNTDSKTLYFALGGHPGFNIPFGKNAGVFEDYYLEFSEKTNVCTYELSESKFMTGETRPAELKEGTKLPLQHSLFDNDAIIFGNTSRSVSLKNHFNKHYITMDFPDFKYLGLWHTPETDAPFVCIEPWSALPARDGITEKLEEKSDYYSLAPEKFYTASYAIRIHE